MFAFVVRVAGNKMNERVQARAWVSEARARERSDKRGLAGGPEKSLTHLLSNWVVQEAVKVQI